VRVQLLEWHSSLFQQHTHTLRGLALAFCFSVFKMVLGEFHAVYPVTSNFKWYGGQGERVRGLQDEYVAVPATKAWTGELGRPKQLYMIERKGEKNTVAKGKGLAEKARSRAGTGGWVAE
jgi:hypothetical protein